MNLHYQRKNLVDGYQPIVTPGNSPLQLIEFGLLRLSEKGQSHADQSVDQEIALVLLHGSGRVEVEGDANDLVTYELSHRGDVFLDRATMVYIPPSTDYKVVSHSRVLDAGVFKAPARQMTASFLIAPDDIERRSVGVANWRRDVFPITRDEMRIERLIVGETIGPPGNWSSYPPHKHDVRSPQGEVPYEEVYFYLIKPADGYGIQRVYDPPGTENGLDEIYVVRDGDTVVVPHGYHPLVAAGGYQIYYLWALAGEGREYGAWRDDPAHAWLRACEPILDERER